MNRLTNNDRNWGPITWGRNYGGGNWLYLAFQTGGEEDPPDKNKISLYAFGWAFRFSFPRIIKPHSVRIKAVSWDAETIARLGRDYYDRITEKQFGFSLMDGHLTIYKGAQHEDSEVGRGYWSWFLPWTQWRHVRHSLYDDSGAHYWTLNEPHPHLDRRKAVQMLMVRTESCPCVSFLFEDFDGERIVAKTRIEEREWRFGTGWFKWLSLFRKNRISRCLDLRFSSEVGPEKGSWKGGTIGHGIEMLPGELHEQAFRRYCDQPHQSKRRKFQLKFIGKVEPASKP